MREIKYNREASIAYAEKWAYARNPRYYNYDAIGGDCTNFISQCLYEGGKKMNEKEWYYRDANNKAPAWTGVEYLYQFLIHNRGIGPFGIEKEIDNLEVGDVIQLSFDGKKFTHSMIIVDKTQENIYVATHTDDSFHRNIETYTYLLRRGLHISGIRQW